jgi:hypothetical protein
MKQYYKLNNTSKLLFNAKEKRNAAANSAATNITAANSNAVVKTNTANTTNMQRQRM